MSYEWGESAPVAPDNNRIQSTSFQNSSFQRRGRGNFRDNAYRHDGGGDRKPYGGRDQGGFGRDQGGFGRDQGGFGRDQGGFGRDQGGFGRDQGGFVRDQGGFGRDQGGFGRDQRQNNGRGRFNRNDGRPQNGNAKNIKIPSRFVGRVIGKGGSKISDLQYESGAKIIVTKEEEDNETIVKLIGSDSEINKAEEMIRGLTVEWESYNKPVETAYEGAGGDGRPEIPVIDYSRSHVT